MNTNMCNFSGFFYFYWVKLSFTFSKSRYMQFCTIIPNFFLYSETRNYDQQEPSLQEVNSSRYHNFLLKIYTKFYHPMLHLQMKLYLVELFLSEPSRCCDAYNLSMSVPRGLCSSHKICRLINENLKTINNNCSFKFKKFNEALWHGPVQILTIWPRDEG